MDLKARARDMRGYMQTARDEASGMEIILYALTPYRGPEMITARAEEMAREMIRKREGQVDAYRVVAMACEDAEDLPAAIAQCEAMLNTQGWAERDPVGQLAWEIESLRSYLPK